MTYPDDLADVPEHVDDQAPEPAPLDEFPGQPIRNAGALDPELDALDVDDQAVVEVEPTEGGGQ